MKKRGTFTLEDLEKSKCAHLNRDIIDQLKDNGQAKKKSKYSNEKVEIDGIEFDSKKEAARYKELRLLLKAGKIGLLRMQVPYELNEGGSHSIKYISDFDYIITDTGEPVVEDTKGFKTKEYIKKRKLMKKVHGITIKEV